MAFAQLHSYGPAMDIGTIVDGIVGHLWVLFVGIAIACFLLAGVTFLTANGAPEKINTAKMAVLWGVVGVVVGIISYSIVLIVGSLIS